MDLRISIDLQGAIVNPPRGTEIVNNGLFRLITALTMFLLVEVKKRTPQGVFGAQGGLLGSIQSDVSGRGTGTVRGHVMTAQKYGLAVEKGRTPGKGLPRDLDLSPWIMLKFGVDAATAKRLNYVVKRAIMRRGTIKRFGYKGAEMFEKALTENLGKLQALATAEEQRIVAELSA